MSIEDELRHILTHPCGSTTGDITRIWHVFQAKYDLVLKQPKVADDT